MLTREQMLDRTKTVTRRLGWKNLRPGTRLLAVERCQGIKPGQTVEIFGEIEVVSVRRERLDAIDSRDCTREGFPGMTRDQFVEMFCNHMTASPGTEITRIEFRHVERST